MKMIPWYIAFIAFFAGGIIGFVITIIMVAKGRDDPRE